MNSDIKLQQCTTPFKDYLLKDLAHPEFAKGYLEAALQDFNEDGNTDILIRCLKDITEAQGGTEILASWTNLSPLTLNNLLSPKGKAQFDSVMEILSKLKESFPSKKVVI